MTIYLSRNHNNVTGNFALAEDTLKEKTLNALFVLFVLCFCTFPPISAEELFETLVKPIGVLYYTLLFL